MTARAHELARLFGLAAAVTLALAALTLRAPSERLFGMEIAGRHYDPFTVMARFSDPFALGVYAQPLTDVPGALLASLLGPVAAYNWLVLLSFPLSAAAAYALARHLAISPPASAAAAMAFAFSPFHLAHAAYHLHVAQTHWIALYFLALWWCLDNPGVRAAALLAVAVAAVALSNFYGGLIAAVLTPVAVLAYWSVAARGRPGGTRGLAVASATLLAAAVGGALYVWQVAGPLVANRTGFGFPRGDLFRYSAPWWSYMVPPVANPLLGAAARNFWGSADGGLVEHQVSLGWGIVALGLVAVVAWLRRNRHQASLTAVPVLAIVATAALVCSLSPERTIGSFTFVRPSALLYLLVPMFRSYGRFAVVVQLMAVLLAGIGAERLWSGGTRARAACLVLVTLAVGEYMVSPAALWRDVLPTSAHRWVMRQPDRLRVLDCAPVTPESASVAWLTSYRVDVRAGWSDDCAQPNVVDKLAAEGYTHVLVRRRTADGFWFASRPLPAGLRDAARFRDAEVIAVVGLAPVLYTTEMTAFYPREYGPTSTWRWMGTEASWTVVNGGHSPIDAALDVELGSIRGPRRLAVLLDGRAVQTLTVDARRLVRVDSLVFTPGSHALAFRPAEAPVVPDAIVHNGDLRRLSFAFGTWHWIVQEDRP